MSLEAGFLALTRVDRTGPESPRFLRMWVSTAKPSNLDFVRQDGILDPATVGLSVVEKPKVYVLPSLRFLRTRVSWAKPG